MRMYPGYGMASLIYNNLLNLIFGTVMFLIIISLDIQLKKTYL